MPYGAEPIAIIGMAALMPQAEDLQRYWANILDGRDCLADVPATRWDPALHFDADPAAPDRTYAKRGGFVPDIPFDPLEFGLPPSVLAATDAAQLLALPVARDALADAGYPPLSGHDHGRTATVVAVAGTTMRLYAAMAARLDRPRWEAAMRAVGIPAAAVAVAADRVGEQCPAWDENAFPGFLASLVAGRLANRFDLGGPSFTLDAACAGSLHAIRAACTELRAGHCDMALAGGVDTDNSAAAFVAFSKTPALSPTGRIRPFDASGDGTLIAEGIGMLVLRRMSDALASGDRIYAAILGTGSSSDGRGSAIYVPSADGQERALRLAVEEAGIDPSTVDLIEAHATGTAVGDAVEIEALKRVYPPGSRPVAVGSVKSQIGHTKAAAGVAGVIKAALALHHRAIPASLGVRTPHPALDGSSYRVPDASLPWRTPPDGVRRAAVSAFGFGGANVHAVLEQAPADRSPPPLTPLPACLTLAAESRAALAALCRRLAEDGWGAWPGNRGVAADRPYRAAVVAVGPEELRAGLLAAAAATAGVGARADPGPDVTLGQGPAPGGLVVAFSGQGGQSVGMGARLAIDHPEVRDAVALFDRALRDAGSGDGSSGAEAPALVPLAEAIWPLPAPDAAGRSAQQALLRGTLYAQAGVGALAMAYWRLLRAAGVRPDVLLGHSYGELPALWAGGAFSDETLAALTAARGRSLTLPSDHDGGGLLAVAAGPDALPAALAAIPDLEIANLNAPSQTVLGGSLEALARAEEALRALDLTAVRLPVAAAFHTALVEPAAGPWKAALAGAAIAAPARTVLANSTGEAYPDRADAVRDTLAEQPFRQVRFRQQVEAAWAAGGRVFLEVGPRATLTRLVADTLQGRPHVATAVDPEAGRQPSRHLQRALAALFAAGIDVQPPLPAWAASHRPAEPRPSTILLGPQGVRPAPPPEPPAAPPMAAPPPSPTRASPPLLVPPPASSAAEPARRAPPAVAEHHAAAPAEADPPGQADAVLRLQALAAEAHREFLAGQVAIASALVSDPSDRALAALREAQEGGARLHQLYLSQQTQMALQLLRSGTPPALGPALAPRPASTTPPEAPATMPDAAPPPPAPAGPRAELEAPSAPLVLERLTAIVAERTGYPPEFIRPEMDLEADLGLDSIKRVEILAALRKSGTPPPEGLRAARTLGAIADAVAGAAAGACAAVEAAPRPDALAMLREVVADRTGYPPDILLPDAALEAELGIDSIKRVEIMNLVAARLGLPRDRLDAAARAAPTLGALAKHLEEAAAGGHPLPASAEGRPTPRPAPGSVSRSRVEPFDARAAGARDAPAHVSLAGGGDVAAAVAVALPGRQASGAGGAPVDATVVFAAEDPAGHRRSLAEAFRLVQQEAERLSTAAAPRLIVVARVDGRLGTGGAAVADLAGLAGALRCLARERPGLEARFVDIDPALGPDAAARAVVAELVTAGGPDAVGVGAGWRMAMRASPLAPAPRAAVLSGGDLVLVTGGARGVTALCAAALARETGARLLLAGRSAPPTPEPDWARGANGRDLRRRAAEAVGGALGAIEAACRAVEAGREIAATLCAAGISATYLQVDITDPAATAAALAPWRAEVTAVVHGAGVLADKPFATIRPTDLDAVLGPKLDGLDAVLAALPEARLRRIALFSSVAAAFGNEGQGAYALANEALNRRVHALARRYPDGLVASINWGPWRGGMVDETLAQRFAQRGTALLEPEAGAAAFLDVVLSEGVGPLEVVIGDAPGAPAVRAVAARA